MQGIESVKNNLTFIQLEQLMTIKKEVLHIKRISNFFSLSRDNPYYKTHQKILVQITRAIEDIKYLKDKIISDAENGHMPYKFLIQYQLNNHEIELLLFNLRHIREQISQYTESSFNQYLPKPYLGRRYSSKAISIFIEAVILEILNKNNNKIQTSLLWDYRSGFESHFKNEDSFCVIETSFYYYELPYFIPNLFHELNHILLKKNNSEGAYNVLLKKFTHTIKNINKNNPIVVIDKGLAEEIVSDIFAYDTIGSSYVFSLFYSIVSDGMPQLFYNRSNKKMDALLNYRGTDMDDSRNQDIVQRVFEVQLRLKLLIEYALNDNSIVDEKVQQELKYIEEFLGYIYCNPIKYTDLSLFHVYDKKGDSLKTGFNALMTGFDTTVDELILQVVEHHPPEVSLDMNYKDIFSSIWESKLTNQDTIYHRNILRKNILKQIFKDHTDIDRLPLTPAELTFFKFNKMNESNNSDIDDYFVNFTGFASNEKKDYNQYECFGIYNDLAIRKKAESVTSNKVKGFLNKVDGFETDFYTYKIAMTKMYGINTNLTPRNAFGAVIQLQLKDYEKDTIVAGYDKIRETLDNEKSVNYDLYKVLGPSDYVIVLNNITLPRIYEIKKSFFNDNTRVFRRTFTSIFRMNNDSEPSEDDIESKLLVSKVRLRYSITLEDLKSKKILYDGKQQGTFEDYYDDIFCLPGAIDIEIQWKVNDYNTIKKVLSHISENISDVQTEYVKIL